MTDDKGQSLSTNEDQLVVVNEEDQMLTTKDNPFNPHEDYAKWRRWDVDNGYNTEEYLARLTDIPSDMDFDDDVAINMLTNLAVQEILEHDPLGVYMLV